MHPCLRTAISLWLALGVLGGWLQTSFARVKGNRIREHDFILNDFRVLGITPASRVPDEKELFKAGESLRASRHIERLLLAQSV